MVKLRRRKEEDGFGDWPVTDVERPKPKPVGAVRVVRTVAELETALRICGGFVSRAAAVLGLSASAVSERVKRSPQLQRALEEIREEALDDAEDGLRDLVRARFWPATKYALDKLGSGRGYGEEKGAGASPPGGGPLEVRVTFVAPGQVPQCGSPTPLPEGTRRVGPDLPSALGKDLPDD
jgi:hypothetical protein